MMLHELKRGDSAVILRTDVPSPIRERLRSLGVYPNAKITMLKVSPFKKTYLLQAGSTQVAMRREIAALIRVFLT
ncbi:MAG: ferrous iron transport protein A [Clostridiales bacterium]|nr:ferrous iron transport protein A [Clostridiales bacterium]